MDNSVVALDLGNCRVVRVDGRVAGEVSTEDTT